MKLLLAIAHEKYKLDTEISYSIAIPLKFNRKQPNHFGAEYASEKPMTAGEFIGNTKQGGSCNANIITLNPHCNGTHTESIHHIVDENINIGRNLNCSLAKCLLISITPKMAQDTTDSYKPILDDKDWVIDLALLKKALDLQLLVQVDALIIRTLPNGKEKLTNVYNDANQPPFFTKQAMKWLAKSPITHLLVDFPSVDRLNDDGHLINHHYFWKVKVGEHKFNTESLVERTITEMVYVKDHIEDGLYCLNLQIPAFESDAAPSRPILFPLTKIHP